jgi:hypothetical protein
VDKISWRDRVTNEVLHGVKKKRVILHTVNRRKVTALVTWCLGTGFYDGLLKEGYGEG